MQYFARRLLLSVVALWLVSLMVFALVRMIPGDAVDAMVDASSSLTPEQQRELRAELGLDQSWAQQYGVWLKGALVGDFGTSLYGGSDTLDRVLRRLPLTLELALASVLVSVVVGVPLGVAAAGSMGSPLDQAIRVVATLALSVPSFVIGSALIVFPSYWFGWAPPIGYVSLTDQPWLHIQQVVLPVLTISSFFVGVLLRVTRSAMLEVLREDYVRTARAKGLRELEVVYRHALRNASIPIVTVMGLGFAATIGGVVITEIIFSLPGLGSLLIDALSRRDYPQIQTTIFVFAIGVIIVNALVDVSYGLLDPRIRS